MDEFKKLPAYYLSKEKKENGASLPLTHERQ